ncbi:MAG: RiPP maturation radical SAM C-methyltransferase, partial [Candidatus Aminicenantes bacterium]
MNRLEDIEKLIIPGLDGGDILFLVPPFARREFAVLGPHILQTIAREMGYKADILYLNILFASIVGDEVYDRISTNPYNLRWMKLGERLFARSAHGLPPLGEFSKSLADEAVCITGNTQQHAKIAYESKNFDLDGLLKLEAICPPFIQEVVRAVTSIDYKMIGCTTTLEQTNCSVAILKAVKKICPEIITIMGGKNCEDQMAEGIASLSRAIDYVFSGESEISFKEFLTGYAGDKLPARRVINGEPLKNLDTIPLPGYESFFKQMRAFLGNNLPKMKAVSYETSRGCWWGQKRRCLFCGNTNTQSIVFQQKSGEKVEKDLEMIAQKYPVNAVLMTDNIVPFSYYEKLLTFLAQKKEFPSIFYQENTDLQLKDLINLQKMRVKSILTGIESLSSGLLKLMNKRVRASQNLLLLRNALSAGIYVAWNMLWGFPGDKAAHYREILKLLPLIRHLQPPMELLHLILVRFSSYVETPQLHHITGLRPMEIYKQIYPQWADIDKLAYEFTGDYPCEAHENPGLIRELQREITAWKTSWQTSNLIMTPSADYYIIHDTRRMNGKPGNHILDDSQAKAVMIYCEYNGSPYQKWAVEEKLGM